MEVAKRFANKRGTVVVDLQDEHGIIRKATLNNALNYS